MFAPTRGFYEPRPKSTLINKLQSQASKDLLTNFPSKPHPSFKPLSTIQFPKPRSLHQRASPRKHDISSTSQTTKSFLQFLTREKVLIHSFESESLTSEEKERERSSRSDNSRLSWKRGKHHLSHDGKSQPRCLYFIYPPMTRKSYDTFIYFFCFCFCYLVLWRRIIYTSTVESTHTTSRLKLLVG